MTETLIIVISILIMIICLILYCMLYTIYKELTSIKLDLMCKHIIINQEKMQYKIDYISSLLDDINETLTNENKEKEKR